jgi:hypothetical protein
MKMTELKKGFEIYYFDGRGGRQGPLDFEAFMTIMGDLDAEGQGGSDTSLYEQGELDLRPPETSDAVSNREPTESSDTGTGTETAEGVRE